MGNSKTPWGLKPRMPSGIHMAEAGPVQETRCLVASWGKGFSARCQCLGPSTVQGSSAVTQGFASVLRWSYPKKLKTVLIRKKPDIRDSLKATSSRRQSGTCILSTQMPGSGQQKGLHLKSFLPFFFFFLPFSEDPSINFSLSQLSHSKIKNIFCFILSMIRPRRAHNDWIQE